MVRVANADSTADYIIATNWMVLLNFTMTTLKNNYSRGVSTVAGGLANPSGDFTIDVADITLLMLMVQIFS